MIGGMVILVGLCVSQAAGAESPFSFRDMDSVGLELSENGKPVFVYNYGMILAPLTLEPGKPLRRSSPIMKRSSSAKRCRWRSPIAGSVRGTPTRMVGT